MIDSNIADEYPLLKEKLEWEIAVKNALLESQERLAQEIKDLRSSMQRLYSLSRYAWEQVDSNPEEAKELFKRIHAIAKEYNKDLL